MVIDGGVDYKSAWDMPVMLRHWWFDEVGKRREEATPGAKPKGHVDPFGRHHK